MREVDIPKAIVGLSGTMLDLGSGMGQVAKYFKNFKITAVDKDRESLDQLFINLRGYDVKTVLSDIRDYKIDTNYDVIVCANVLHFLKKEEPPGIIKNIQEHTKIGGLNIISGFTINGELKSPNFFQKGELKNYYSGHKILHYEESVVDVYERHTDGSNKSHELAFIIAKKVS